MAKHDLNITVSGVITNKKPKDMRGWVSLGTCSGISSDGRPCKCWVKEYAADQVEHLSGTVDLPDD